MTDKIKRAFGEVRAPDELKADALEFVTRKSRRASKTRALCGIIITAAAALALFVGLGTARLYFTPVSVISIDVNPSVELGVNRFERVISVEGFGEDGKVLARKLDVRYKNYEDALSEILDGEDFANYLSESETVVISVVNFEDGEQSALIAENVEAQTAGAENIYCHHSRYEDVAAAHSQGLSYGKYLAFLEAKEDNPQLTVDDIKGLSMHELHELTHHSDEQDGSDRDYVTDNDNNYDINDAADTESEINTTSGNRHHGAGNGHHGNC